MNPNPNHDGTDSVLPVLAIGNETSCLDGRVVNLLSFQELVNLGSNSVPDNVKHRVEDSINGLGREMRVPTFGDREGIFDKIRAVEEVRMVRRDTVVVHGSLLVRDSIGETAVLSVEMENAERWSVWNGRGKRWHDSLDEFILRLFSQVDECVCGLGDDRVKTKI